jgi:outer membrane protein
VEHWVDAALTQNIGLRAKLAAVEVAQQEIKRREAGHYPTLGFVMSHNRRDAGSTLFGGGSKVETIDMMLRLSIPLYEGGLIDAATREAVERYAKSQEEFEQERRAVDRATRASFEGALSAVSLVQALKQSMVAQRSALEAKEEGFRSGLFGLLPVLDAQRDLYLAQRDFEQSRYDYLLNRLRLKLAAGTLSELDLASIDAVLR